MIALFWYFIALCILMGWFIHPFFDRELFGFIIISPVIIVIVIATMIKEFFEGLYKIIFRK